MVQFVFNVDIGLSVATVELEEKGIELGQLFLGGNGKGGEGRRRRE